MEEDQKKDEYQEVQEGESQEKNLRECEKLRDEYLDGWKRAKADFINYKREEAERLEKVVRFSNESMIQELISVLDSFDLGLAILKDDSVRKGVELIRVQLDDILKKHGLEAIGTSPGDQFDPEKHEAVLEIVSEMPEGVITEEVEKGYVLHGKVIRPSRVKISKGHTI